VTAPHCPGCRGYTADWQHECPGIVLPGNARELIEGAIGVYAIQLEIGPPPGQPFRELADMILIAVGAAPAEPAEPAVPDREPGGDCWKDPWTS
jgi:hypothetical protein